MLDRKVSNSFYTKNVIELAEEDEEKIVQQCTTVHESISIVNSKHLIISGPLKGNTNLESISRSVGRIFTKYIDEKDKIHWSKGTGFLVTENKVMTARHVILAPKNCTVKSIYIYFESNGTVGYNFNLEEIDDDFFELEVVKTDNSTLTTTTSSTTIQQDNILFCYMGNNEFRWNTPNDIEVLSFKNSKPEKPVYLLPSIPSDIYNVDFYTIGYSGLMSIDRFKAEYCVENQKNEELESIYKQIQPSFQHKTVCKGRLETFSNAELSLHKIPTLKGQSGGTITNGLSSNNFSAVHLGGSNRENLKSNFAISVTHPIFCQIYQQKVLSEIGFLEKHSIELEPFLNYFNSLVSHKVSHEKIN